MTEDRIAEIRARHDAVHNVLRGASQMHADRGYLLAEVERLTRERDEARAEVERQRAEIERQRREIKNLREAIQSLAERLEVDPSGTDKITELEAEIERLRADLATQQGCCDGAAAQDAHVRREREEHRSEVERQRAEIERMRDVLRRVVVYPSGDRAARVAFVSVGCQVSFPLHPQTTWALELLVEFDQARRAALEGKS